MGSDTYLREITETVAIPVLRKDFTVDKYMIYQAKSIWRIGSASDLHHSG